MFQFTTSFFSAKKYHTLLLALILALALFLRAWHITSNPQSLYGDELTLVYDAYSISQIAHDQKGKFLPLVFDLGGSRPPGYVYLDVPFTAMLGPTALAARLPSVLAGLGIVYLVYLLAQRLFGTSTALVAGLFAAISPWGISLSRAAFESNLALFFALLGTYLLVLAYLRIQTSLNLILSALFLGLSMQTYPTYRLMIPVFICGLALTNITQLKKIVVSHKLWPKAIALTIFLFSFILSIILTFGNTGHDRFSTISILNDPTITSQIVQNVDLDRNMTELPRLLLPLFHNKYIELGKVFVNNYSSFLSWNFLFTQGDGNPRHNPAGLGEIYLVFIITLIIAVYYLFREKRRLFWFLTLWILTAPLAGALVGESHALRASFMLPPFILLGSFGFVRLTQIKYQPKFIKKGLICLLILATVIQFAFVYEGIFFLAPRKYALFWSYPAKIASQLAAQNQQNYQYIVLSNDIADMEYAYPVYNQINPNLVIQQNEHSTNLAGFQFFQYGHVFIGSIPDSLKMQFLQSLPGSVLYIGPAEDKNLFQNYQAVSTPEGTDILTTIKFP
ncbi:glycosyltransferase family 39 protein [Patescibacteria group bacterium]|nr:glycosyltransferase family 39 protein [Patescibacteria group bacterium]